LRYPPVYERIKALSIALEDHELLSKADHAFQLAEIRDRAKDLNQLKVAKECEMARGMLMGWYQKDAATPVDGALSVYINIGGVVKTVTEHREQLAPPDQDVEDAAIIQVHQSA
jgi:hypothetical protein